MKRAIDATETLVKFLPKGCDIHHAIKVIGTFSFLGFIAGLSIGLFLAP